MPVSRHLSIWGIIAVATLVFGAEQIRETSFADSAGLIPTRVRAATNSILAGHVGLEEAKAYGTFVSSMFLHGDPEHIVYNMVFLWTFGVLTTDLLGQWRTLAIFFITGICGGILHIALNLDSSVPAIGASGAISGLIGCYVGLAVRWPMPNVEVWPLAHAVPPIHLGLFGILGFLGDLILFANHDQHIAYGAHLGGFLAGVAIAAVVTTVYPTLHAYEKTFRANHV